MTCATALLLQPIHDMSIERCLKCARCAARASWTSRHVGTDDNLADIFTKVLPRRSFEKHRRTILNTAGGDIVESLRAARCKYDGDKADELQAFAAGRAQRSSAMRDLSAY